MNLRSPWGIIPPDLTPSLKELKRRGLTDEKVSGELAFIAERIMNTMGEAEQTPMNLCWTLEAAATEWLESERKAGVK